ncbi:MAG: hypothetical protein ACE5GX_07560 [Thermoanaerobaculia bacterium]
MPRSTDFQQTLPNIIPKPACAATLAASALSGWHRPTFGEFVRQIEHEFGDGVNLSSLYMIRADRNERLTPESVRSLCDLLGIPPEDFGV